MSPSSDFHQAVKDALSLTRRPDNETLLRLYSLFKQATEGDVSGKKPGMLDLKGRKKFEAWEANRGMPKEEAEIQYIKLVETLKKG